MRITYRGLDQWKYQVMVDHTEQTPILDEPFSGGFLSLTEGGILTIMKGYCWDGPSGPTWDTSSAMRGSLVHDALYQLIRMGVLPWTRRDEIDQQFYEMLREDGMGRFRAGYFFRAVRLFGWRASRPRKTKPLKEAP